MAGVLASRVARLAETLRDLSVEFHGLRFLAAEALFLESAARELETLRAENDRLRLEPRAPEPAEGFAVEATLR